MVMVVVVIVVVVSAAVFVVVDDIDVVVVTVDIIVDVALEVCGSSASLWFVGVSVDDGVFVDVASSVAVACCCQSVVGIYGERQQPWQHSNTQTYVNSSMSNW